MGKGPKSKSDSDTEPSFDHIELGAVDTPVTYSSYEAAHKGDSDFSRFRIRLNEYLQHLSTTEAQANPLAQKLPALKSGDKVRAYHQKSDMSLINITVQSFSLYPGQLRVHGGLEVGDR